MEEVEEVNILVLSSRKVNSVVSIIDILSQNQNALFLAIGGRDFETLDMTVSLISGLEGGQCFQIITINDTAVEGTETFSVSLTNPVGVTIGTSEVIISIDDDNDSKYEILTFVQ